MRNIIKNIRLPIDGKPMDFRLTKLDAFSGASLLRLLVNLPVPGNTASSGCHSERSEESFPDSFLHSIFLSLSPEDLKSVMTSCLNHTEVLLPAGYQPVMHGSSWSWPELEHDPVTCLKLVLEEAVWTLSGFFGEGGPTSGPAAPDT